MATFKQTQANKKKREQLLEMINKGYTPEFIKFASYANGGNVSEVETELNALNDLGFGGEDPNQVEVEGRKFKINTLADQAAYNKLESAKTEASGLAESALSDFDLKLTQLETAITDKKGLAAAVGTNFLGRAPIASKFEGDKQRFLGTVDQIVSTDALDALISAKSKGATFGALSEGEMKILKSSATRFGTWEVRDKNGAITGYNVDEATFLKELKIVKDLTVKSKTKLAESVAPAEASPAQEAQTQQYRLNGQLVSKEDALSWANKNQDDPKSSKILGMLGGAQGSGNIDLANRPQVGNQDGSISTVLSKSFNIDGKEVLMPTIINGKKVTDEEAISYYKETGENLGIFDTIEEANAAGEKIHQDEAGKLEKKGDLMGTLGKVGEATGSFLGGDEIGEAIGNFLGGKIAKHGKAGETFKNTIAQIEKYHQEGKIDEKKRDEMIQQQVDSAKDAFGYDGPSAKAIIGDIGQAALTVGTMAIPGGGGFASKVVKGVATGYGFDVATGLQSEEDSLGEAFKPGVGTALGILFPVAGAAKNWLAKGGQGIAERVMNSVIKPATDDIKKAILYKGKTLGKEMLEDGFRGTKKIIFKKANKVLEATEDKLQKVLSSSKELIKKEELLPYLSKLKDKLINTPTPRAQKALEAVDDAIKLLPDEFNLSKANILKRNLYSELRDLAYKLDPNLSPSSETSKAIAGGLKDLIEKKSGSTLVSEFNKKLATAGKIQDGILDQIAKTQKNNLLGVGTIGSLIEKTLGASAVKTYGAAIINKASQILEKAGAGKSVQITKTMIISALEKAKKDSNRQ